MVIKTTSKGAAKDPGTSGSAQKLKILSFMGKYSKEKDMKYDKYAARREDRNLRTNALTRYVFRILEGKNLKPRASAPIIFTDEDLATIKLPHVNPLVIKLRIRDAIVSRVLVDERSSLHIIFWSAL